MKNPYAKRDGSPRAGLTAEWENWLADTEKARREALTQQERDAEDAARRPLKRRMQAESDFR